jgi:hypothetical protein
LSKCGKFLFYKDFFMSRVCSILFIATLLFFVDSYAAGTPRGGSLEALEGAASGGACASGDGVVGSDPTVGVYAEALL